MKILNACLKLSNLSTQSSKAPKRYMIYRILTPCCATRLYLYYISNAVYNKMNMRAFLLMIPYRTSTTSKNWTWYPTSLASYSLSSHFIAPNKIALCMTFVRDSIDHVYDHGHERNDHVQRKSFANDERCLFTPQVLSRL